MFCIEGSLGSSSPRVAENVRATDDNQQLFYNYGPYHFPKKLIPLTILKALHGEPIPVYGKGDNIRDWVYGEDHARALYTILSESRWERATMSEAMPSTAILMSLPRFPDSSTRCSQPPGIGRIAPDYFRPRSTGSRLALCHG